MLRALADVASDGKAAFKGTCLVANAQYSWLLSTCGALGHCHDMYLTTVTS